MGNELMSAHSGKAYNSQGKIVTFTDAYDDTRKAVTYTKNDKRDRSIFRGVGIGNLGIGLESNTGLPSITSYTLNRGVLTSALPSQDYNFVLCRAIIIVKASDLKEEKFGVNRVIAIDAFKDDTQIYNRQYKNLVELASIGNGLSVGVNAVKLNGTNLNLYSTVIDFCGDTGGLVFRNDDYLRVRALDVTDPQNPVESPVDLQVCTFGFNGYLAPIGGEM